jgi:hypothetical protein
MVYFPVNKGQIFKLKNKNVMLQILDKFKAKFGHVSSVRAGLGQVLLTVFESFHKPCCYHC